MFNLRRNTGKKFNGRVLGETKIHRHCILVIPKNWREIRRVIFRQAYLHPLRIQGSIFRLTYNLHLLIHVEMGLDWSKVFCISKKDVLSLLSSKTIESFQRFVLKRPLNFIKSKIGEVKSRLGRIKNIYEKVWFLYRLNIFTYYFYKNGKFKKFRESRREDKYFRCFGVKERDRERSSQDPVY